VKLRILTKKKHLSRHAVRRFLKSSDRHPDGDGSLLDHMISIYGARHGRSNGLSTPRISPSVVGRWKPAKSRVDDISGFRKKHRWRTST